MKRRSMRLVQAAMVAMFGAATFAAPSEAHQAAISEDLKAPRSFAIFAEAGRDGLSFTPQEVERHENMAEIGSADPTPDGFELFDPGYRVTDYKYRSDTGTFYLGTCWENGCAVSDEWDIVFEQTLVGGSSTRWDLFPKLTRDYGTTPVSFSYSYYCGVNVAFGDDTLCAGAGAEHSHSGPLNVGDSINKSFGASEKRVFPMLQITAVYHTDRDRSSTNKFRGWDSCKFDTGRELCQTAS